MSDVHRFEYHGRRVTLAREEIVRASSRVAAWFASVAGEERVLVLPARGHGDEDPHEIAHKVKDWIDDGLPTMELDLPDE